VNRGRGAVLVVATGVASLFGCVEEPAASVSGSIVVRDSAGVQVVEIGVAALAGVPVASLGPARVVLGDDPGEPEALFGRVVGATVLDGGAIAVADQDGTRVLIFSPRGEFIGLIGRRGEGPTEFSTVTSIASTGDTLVVFDAGAWRTSTFTADGRLLSTVRLQPHATHADKRFGRPAHGQVFVHWWRSDRRPEWGTPGGLLDDSLTTVVDRIDPEGTVRIDSVRATRVGYAALSVEEYERLSAVARGSFAVSAVMPSPLHGPELVGLLPDGVITGRSGEFELRRFNAGGELVQVLRVDGPGPAGAEFSMGVLQDLAVLSIPNRSLHGLARSLVRDAGIPDRLSHFTSIVGGEDGAVLLAVSAGPSRAESAEWIEWLKLSADGVPALKLRIPARLEILEFGADHVAGVYRDSLEVETVRVYEIPPA
jgi:hypothetical protein